MTDDGAETDLDLGHYERFIDENLSQASNVTTGRSTRRSSPRSDAATTSAGRCRSSRTSPTRSRSGSRGSPARGPAAWPPAASRRTAWSWSRSAGRWATSSRCHLEAIRQMRKDVGRRNVLYVHVTWLPQIGATGEVKTKPAALGQGAARDRHPARRHRPPLGRADRGRHPRQGEPVHRCRRPCRHPAAHRPQHLRGPAPARAGRPRQAHHPSSTSPPPSRTCPTGRSWWRIRLRGPRSRSRSSASTPSCRRLHQRQRGAQARRPPSPGRRQGALDRRRALRAGRARGGGPRARGRGRRARPRWLRLPGRGGRSARFAGPASSASTSACASGCSARSSSSPGGARDR